MHVSFSRKMNFIKITVILLFTTTILKATEPEILGEFDDFCTTCVTYCRAELRAACLELTPRNLKRMSAVANVQHTVARARFLQKTIDTLQDSPRELRNLYREHLSTIEMMQMVQEHFPREKQGLEDQKLKKEDLFTLFDYEVINLGMSDHSDCRLPTSQLISMIAEDRAVKSLKRQGRLPADFKYSLPKNEFLGSVVESSKYPDLQFLFGESDTESIRSILEHEIRKLNQVISKEKNEINATVIPFYLHVLQEQYQEKKNQLRFLTTMQSKLTRSFQASNPIEQQRRPIQKPHRPATAPTRTKK